MTMNFGKIYAGMYQGSMVGKGALAFAVMGYVIANMAPNVKEPEKLMVELNPKLLGFILGESEADVCGAIEFLCSPDPDSRSEEEDGKRLVKVGQYSYWVVNGRKYREAQVVEKRREQLREAQKRFRGKKGVSAGSGPLPGEATFLKTGEMPHEYEQLEGKGPGGDAGPRSVSRKGKPAVEKGSGGTLSDVVSIRPGEDGGKGDNSTGVADGGVLSEEEKERFRKQFLEATSRTEGEVS